MDMSILILIKNKKGRKWHTTNVSLLASIGKYF